MDEVSRDTSLAAKRPRQQDMIQLIPPKEFKGSKRLPDESFEDYKKRRKVEQLSAKHHMRGRMIRGGGTFRHKESPEALAERMINDTKQETQEKEAEADA